jgi:GNAT superfamily N-acetyltransferase
MLIRPARFDDAHALAEVHVSSWRAAYRGIVADSILDDLSVEAWTERWRQRISAETATRTLVLTSEETVIGFATVGPARDSDCSADETQEVYAIYLRSEYWRHGYGRRLYLASEEQMRRSGANGAVLWVLRDNARARRFYEGQGYTVDRVQPKRTRQLNLAELRYRKELGAVS